MREKLKKSAQTWLTWIMRPMTKTMATQETMSAWFWMTNSWLRIGGFLVELFRPLIATILDELSPTERAKGARSAFFPRDRRLSPSGARIDWIDTRMERQYEYTWFWALIWRDLTLSEVSGLLGMSKGARATPPAVGSNVSLIRQFGCRWLYRWHRASHLSDSNYIHATLIFFPFFTVSHGLSGKNDCLKFAHL